jgi:hypothetical protein
LFIRSLPEGSFFNVVRFGSFFIPLFNESVLYSTESVSAALKLASEMDSDLGGTEIMSPLRSIFETPLKGVGARQIFVLTDGEVGDTSAVIAAARANRNLNRCFTIGIGDGADAGLVEGLADATGGRADFVRAGEDLSAKVIPQLELSLEPLVSNVAVHIEAQEGLEISPYPMGELSVNVAFPFYVRAPAELPSGCPILLTGSFLGEAVDIVIESLPCDGFEDISRCLRALFAFETIQSLERAIQRREGDVTTLTQRCVAESLESGVLCSETAFVGFTNAKYVGRETREWCPFPRPDGSGNRAPCGAAEPMVPSGLRPTSKLAALFSASCARNGNSGALFDDDSDTTPSDSSDSDALFDDAPPDRHRPRSSPSSSLFAEEPNRGSSSLFDEVGDPPAPSGSRNSGSLFDEVGDPPAPSGSRNSGSLFGDEPDLPGPSGAGSSTSLFDSPPDRRRSSRSLFHDALDPPAQSRAQTAPSLFDDADDPVLGEFCFRPRPQGSPVLFDAPPARPPSSPSLFGDAPGPPARSRSRKSRSLFGDDEASVQQPRSRPSSSSSLFGDAPDQPRRSASPSGLPHRAASAAPTLIPDLGAARPTSPRGGGFGDLSGAVSLDLRAVTSLQSLDGSWPNSQPLFALVGRRVGEFTSLARGPQKDAIFATIVAVAILRAKCRERQPAWKMIEAKALQWLSVRCIGFEALIEAAVGQLSG